MGMVVWGGGRGNVHAISGILVNEDMPTGTGQADILVSIRVLCQGEEG
jgi:hypothetical protein